MIKTMVGPHIDDESVGFIVDTTFKEAGVEANGVITYDKFSAV